MICCVKYSHWYAEVKGFLSMRISQNFTDENNLDKRIWNVHRNLKNAVVFFKQCQIKECKLKIICPRPDDKQGKRTVKSEGHQEWMDISQEENRESRFKSLLLFLNPTWYPLNNLLKEISPYSCFNLNVVLWLDCLGVKGGALKKMKKEITETKKGWWNRTRKKLVNFEIWVSRIVLAWCDI